MPGSDDSERDQYLLESGRLPTAVERRLAEVSSGRMAFTGDLSPGEAALLRREGIAPLALVTGSCMYHVGIAYASSWGDCEVAQLSAAYNDATRLAAQRLTLEARALGAHGVLGVRYAIVRHEWADKSVEVQLVGTAVRTPEPTPASPPSPWLCDLSGQEWWALRQAGYQPVALAYGHCTWFILTQLGDEWTEQSVSNAELSHFSTALGQCRTRAAMHVKSIARDAGAHGVVGVRIERRLDEVRLTGTDDNPAYEREHHNLVLSMVGTAVKRVAVPAAAPGPSLALSLRDGRLRPAREDARFT